MLKTEGRCGGGIAYQDTARVRHWSFLASCFMLTVEGRCGGGIAYQDTARVLICTPLTLQICFDN